MVLVASVAGSLQAAHTLVPVGLSGACLWVSTLHPQACLAEVQAEVDMLTGEVQQLQKHLGRASMYMDRSAALHVSQTYPQHVAISSDSLQCSRTSTSKLKLVAHWVLV